MKKLLCIFLAVSINAQADDPVVSLGERLFNDFRFSQFFYKASNGNVNHTLKNGDFTRDEIQIGDLSLPSPFAGGATSCASCHMVDQSFEDIGMRGYNDFSAQTKISKRSDGKKLTLRNTPSLIGIGSSYVQNAISHYDGEFFNHRQTVLGNFAGRNMGWLKSEKQIALKNIVNVIKNDNGKDDLGLQFGGPYKKVLKSTAQDLPAEFILPKKYRLDVTSATDEQIINKVIFFIEQYLLDLDFENEDGVYSGSMYDEFLKLNNLPSEPKASQSLEDYTSDLIKGITNLKSPKFIPARYFPNHKKSFGFGENEYRGMRIFFNIDHRPSGQCAKCHLPPMFSDQKFHNIGSTQIEYEQIHGAESFKKLQLPSLAQRNKKNIYYMQRPDSDTKNVDLGVWNFFGRDDKKALTQYLKTEVCKTCSDDELLELLVARVKTPSLRNLGHSAPYFHNGSAQTLASAVQQYVRAKNMARSGTLINPSEHFQDMHIMGFHIDDLVSFLESLNENYE